MTTVEMTTLEHFLEPMEYQTYPFMKDIHVEAFQVVPCLVVVHGYSRCEHHCRNPVFNEDPLVREPVEYLCEVGAAVVIKADVKADSCFKICPF